MSKIKEKGSKNTTTKEKQIPEGMNKENQNWVEDLNFLLYSDEIMISDDFDSLCIMLLVAK